MAAPRKGSNLTAKLRAYEMYASGMRKAEIARELGLTKACIGAWAKLGMWDSRLSDIVSSANAAADLEAGGELAAALAQLKRMAARRVAELELLCHAPDAPTRMKAIQLWLKLAGMDRAIISPTNPVGDKPSLELVEDLLERT